MTRKKTTYRFLKYCIVGTVTTLLGWGLLYTFTEFLHIWYLYSSMLGTVVVAVTAFVLNNWWTWGKNEEKEIEWLSRLLRRFRGEGK